jgi:hypothetical protein
MDLVFLPKSGTKYSNLSLLPSQPGREQDWGLSLSYDIVKAHGGELKVEQRKGKVQYLLFNYQQSKSFQ